jgi:hypothetical protein
MKTTFAVFAVLAALAQPILAQETPKAAKEAGRPGKILSEKECTTLWGEAAGRMDLTADQAKPYVTNFEQVDTNSDKKIDNAEFKAGCKLGFVQHASKDSGASTGSSTGEGDVK